MAVTKLTIAKVADKKATTLAASSNPADMFTCQFNPTEFVVDKGTKYSQSRAGKGADLAKLAFVGGANQTMELKLTFDSTDTGNAVFQLYTLLRTFADVDTSALDPKTRLGEPPWVIVQWGTFISFVCVVEKLTERYTYFHPNGTPLRADVSLTLRQVSKSTSNARQNPTSESEPRRTWIVEEGQRLDWIAAQEYGDSSAWRHIAEVNGINNPFSLHSGQVLKLTPRS